MREGVELELEGRVGREEDIGEPGEKEREPSVRCLLVGNFLDVKHRVVTVHEPLSISMQHPPAPDTLR